MAAVLALARSKLLIYTRAMALVFALLAPMVASPSTGHVPNQLKAAYLYNIAKLVAWPDQVLPSKDTHLVFCTSASESFTQELRDISDRPLTGRRVQVVALGARSEADFCHLVFVDEDHTQNWFKYHGEGKQGQLVVGEDPSIIAKGGVINFFVEGEKLRFEISIQNAKGIDVKISSRLLKLARIVEGAGND